MKPFFFLIVYFLFQISCSDRDKLLHLLALLKLELVQKKVLIFVNSIDNGFRIRLFLEQFGIRSSVLNAELPQNSRLHILEVCFLTLYPRQKREFLRKLKACLEMVTMKNCPIALYLSLYLLRMQWSRCDTELR
ncbi:hypothetical protein B296_00050549 [Ensete ventricosum]|uniref:Uncharacterized protein n=1 Tax=Ensete ventricosum TaxID=4639 RepID=A0A426YKL9_ENSVE|nr:hypothetical protein B296_00050549 [Ensete ventricosum]